jgi:hypothetical protein
MIFKLFGPNLLGSNQKAKCNGQVKGPSIFSEISGGKINYSKSLGRPISQVEKRPFDAVHTFPDSRFGQPNQKRFGLAGGDIHLDLDINRINSGESKGSKFG